MTPSPDPEQRLSMAVEDSGLRFPAACPRCLQPANTRIIVQKVFPQYESDPRVVTFYPLFCVSCTATHKREVQRPGLDVFFRRLWKGGGTSFGAVANSALGLFLTPKLLPQVFTAGVAGLIPLGVLVFFWGVGAVCLWVVMDQTRYMTCAPPTSITSAVDFTDDHSDMFEPSWRRFTFQNSGYAQMFREANAERVWRKRSEKAQKAASKRSVFKIAAYSVVGAVVVYSIYDELHDWWQSIIP